jgi:hypothetical protein
MQGTIEEAMLRIVERKEKLATVCMTRNKGGSRAQRSDLAELVELFRDKKKSTDASTDAVEEEQDDEMDEGEDRG